MKWFDDSMRDAARTLSRSLREAAQAQRQAQREAARAQREAARAARSVAHARVTAGSTINRGGGITQSATADGRPVSTGPGYALVGDRYWVTGEAYEIRIDRDGTVTADGVELPEGRPIPGDTGTGVRITLERGRLSINGVPITDYTAPSWAKRVTIRQAGGHIRM